MCDGLGLMYRRYAYGFGLPGMNLLIAEAGQSLSYETAGLQVGRAICQGGILMVLLHTINCL